MSTSLTAARRRVALGVGALLAAGALAGPAGASAITVHPATTVEGNSGHQRAVTTVDLPCSTYRCVYGLRFSAGTALGFEDFVWDPPRDVSVRNGETVTEAMAIEVLGDTKVEDDETYDILVEETYYARCDECPGGEEELGFTVSDGPAPGPFQSTAGTIVNDDRICRFCAEADASVAGSVADLLYPTPGP